MTASIHGTIAGASWFKKAAESLLGIEDRREVDRRTHPVDHLLGSRRELVEDAGNCVECLLQSVDDELRQLEQPAADLDDEVHGVVDQVGDGADDLAAPLLMPSHTSWAKSTASSQSRRSAGRPAAARAPPQLVAGRHRTRKAGRSGSHVCSSSAAASGAAG